MLVLVLVLPLSNDTSARFRYGGFSRFFQETGSLLGFWLLGALVQGVPVDGVVASAGAYRPPRAEQKSGDCYGARDRRAPGRKKEKVAIITVDSFRCDSDNGNGFHERDSGWFSSVEWLVQRQGFFFFF